MHLERSGQDLMFVPGRVLVSVSQMNKLEANQKQGPER